MQRWEYDGQYGGGGGKHAWEGAGGTVEEGKKRRHMKVWFGCSEGRANRQRKSRARAMEVEMREYRDVYPSIFSLLIQDFGKCQLRVGILKGRKAYLEN